MSERDNPIPKNDHRCGKLQHIFLLPPDYLIASANVAARRVQRELVEEVVRDGNIENCWSASFPRCIRISVKKVRSSVKVRSCEAPTSMPGMGFQKLWGPL